MTGNLAFLTFAWIPVALLYLLAFKTKQHPQQRQVGIVAFSVYYGRSGDNDDAAHPASGRFDSVIDSEEPMAKVPEGKISLRHNVRDLQLAHRALRKLGFKKTGEKDTARPGIDGAIHTSYFHPESGSRAVVIHYWTRVAVRLVASKDEQRAFRKHMKMRPDLRLV